MVVSFMLLDRLRMVNRQCPSLAKIVRRKSQSAGLRRLYTQSIPTMMWSEMKYEEFLKRLENFLFWTHSEFMPRITVEAQNSISLIRREALRRRGPFIERALKDYDFHARSEQLITYLSNEILSPTHHEGAREEADVLINYIRESA